MDLEDARPIFVQVARAIEREIVDGGLAEESQVPSINELAALHRINPATALKGINLLVDAGVLYKRRGVGMFVAAGARQRIVATRRAEFGDQFVRPLAAEAAQIGIAPAELADMIKKEMDT